MVLLPSGSCWFLGFTDGLTLTHDGRECTEYSGKSHPGAQAPKRKPAQPEGRAGQEFRAG